MQSSEASAVDDQGLVNDEAALIRAAQRDRRAFGLLYERHVVRVYAYLRSRTENEEDAADGNAGLYLQRSRPLCTV